MSPLVSAVVSATATATALVSVSCSDRDNGVVVVSAVDVFQSQSVWDGSSSVIGVKWLPNAVDEEDDEAPELVVVVMVLLVVLFLVRCCECSECQSLCPTVTFINDP